MQFDLSPFFDEYDKIVRGLDSAFEQIQAQYPQEVRCQPGCCECCYALFDLTLVEAMALNRHFHANLDQEKKKQVLERAERADREIHRIKHQAYKAQQKGVETEEIFRDVGAKRVRCPLLTEDNACVLYAHRPLTCRVYGLPLQIHGQVRTCGMTGFEPGKSYPSINMDRLQDKLLDISQRMVASMPTKYDKLAEVMVPVSMALLTEYDDDYLGIVHAQEHIQSQAAEWTLGPVEKD
ncbi:YkgJ family cysteine cluster protein, partial [Desulfovermiculus halophilus]|jgi:Fe-S-cluster containining protein|uniref:YkgJ family cysteine cluster protein n=1 Tax=Desulfovermiculus halophilus TaxID=339722 RepID=UPI0005584948